MVGKMTYCPKCGKKNDDDATYCSDCGASLIGTQGNKKEKEECEEECFGGSRVGPYIWGIIIILIGLTIVVNSGLDKIEGMEWLQSIDMGWVLPLIIGIAIIFMGARMLLKKK
jgi:hypothetical protein